jgi:uncharacterized membrane protein
VDETVIVLWLHITAAVTWLGGKIFTSFVLNPVLRLQVPRDTRLKLLEELGWRFRYMSWGSLFVLAATGAVLLEQRITGSPEWLHSEFGGVLVLKLLLVAAMIAISAGHTMFLTPWVRRTSLEGGEGLRRARKVLVLVSRANILLGVLVILLAAML